MDRVGVSDALAAALATLAAEQAIPAVSTAPFMSVQQRDLAAREFRRRARWRKARLGAVIAAVLIAVHFLATGIIFRNPAEEALEAQAQKIAAAVLPLHSSLDRPFRLDSTAAVFRERIDSSHVRYFARVVLRLRQPLYAPASTNGTNAYRQLQESLALARARELKIKHALSSSLPEAADLPMMLQMVHRAGEAMVVLVPFEAVRLGWGWRFLPANLKNRTAEPAFGGAVLETYTQSAYLIFGAPGALATIRARMKAARDYIIAVNKEMQHHPESEGAADSTALKPAVNGSSGPISLPVFDPDAVALPAPPNSAVRAVNPDAPAVNPDAPAINPDAPAQPAASQKKP